MHSFQRAIKTIAAILLLSACGGSEIIAFSVTETKVSDCTQNPSNQVQCFDPDSLAIAKNIGRYTIEYVGDRFILTTATGQTMAGIHFVDNGRTVSNTCIGEGGQCHFARTRVDSTDPVSGCTTILDRIIDVRIIDGEMLGTFSDRRFVNDCDQANVREVLIDIRGQELPEAISAREGLEE